MTARAALFYGTGRPFEPVEFTPPTPLGAEILVKVTCCTLCRSDLSTFSGRRTEPTPTVLGHEIVGRIEAFGPTAAAVDARGNAADVGSRVTWAITAGCGTCPPCVDDLPQKCVRVYKYGHLRADPARPVGGGLSEYVLLVPGTTWFVVPDGLPDAVVAPANCATATSAGLVRHAGPISGRTVLVVGAGVLGVTAVALAADAGATVFVVDPLPAMRERAVRFGAAAAFAPEELNREIKDRTGGRGADVVIELAGSSASVESALRVVRTGGKVILAGTVAPTPPVPLDPEAVVRRMLTICGVHNYHPRDLAAALTFLEGPGRSLPFDEMVTAQFPLSAVDRAFAHAAAMPGSRVAVVTG